MEASADPDDPRMQRFHALYRGEFAFVWSTAQHLGVPSGMVDEVVQDVFLTAYRRLEHLRFEVSPRAWLFGVTRRVAHRYRRGAARRARRMANFAELARPAAESPQQRHDDAQQLAGLLAGLSEGTRAVWELTEVLGMSAPEIASELGLPLNTVYSRLRLARHQLEQRVADPEQLAAWRDSLRHTQAPPREAQRRSWAVLLPALGKPGGAGLLAWIGGRVGMTTLWVATGATAVGLTISRPEARVSVPEAAPVVVRAPVVSTTPVVAAAPVVATQRPVRSAEDRARARLAEEVALIDRLQAELGRGESAAALATAQEHARKFADGVLVDVREAAQIDALCRSGEAAAAEAAALRLTQAHPGSAVAQRFARYHCGG